MRCLVISNGKGEDTLACFLLAQLLAAAPKEIKLEIIPFPLVGDGLAYEKLGLPVHHPWQSLPSGGFFASSFQTFFNDFKKRVGPTNG